MAPVCTRGKRSSCRAPGPPARTTFSAVDDGEAVGVQRDGAGGAQVLAFADGDERDDHAPLVKGDVLQARLADERPAHLARGIGADGGGPLARVVVRLVADDLTIGIGGERHAEVLQVQERAGGRLATRARSPCMEPPRNVTGHGARRIRIVAAHGQLVVGLLSEPVLIGAHLRPQTTRRPRRPSPPAGWRRSGRLPRCRPRCAPGDGTLPHAARSERSWSLAAGSFRTASRKPRAPGSTILQPLDRHAAVTFTNAGQ